MQQRFESKRDLWIVAILWGALLTMVAVPIYAIGLRPSLFEFLFVCALTVPFAVLILKILYGTYYVVDGETLVVRSGPLRWRVPLAKIKSVKRTHSFLSSPALSMDRLRIRYGHGRMLMVSPEDQRAFLSAIGQPET